MSVRIDSVEKSFGAVRVLHPLSLEVRKGELLALLGPSGCGKTTLLRILAGLERADTGRVFLDGADVTAVPPERRGLGMVFQHYAVWPHRTVRGNVSYPLERAGVAKDEIARRVGEALALVHLGEQADRGAHQLSGGQLQRVALARALVGRPRVLLLDEPLSNLDAQLREEMRTEIRSLQRRLGITTILVTHDQAEALSIADRVAVLSEGRVEQLGAPEEIYGAPATRFVAAFVGGGNLIPARSDGTRLVVGDASLPAPAGTRTGAVTLVVRPEELVPDPDGFPMRVTERLFLGERVELHLDWHGVPLRASVGAAQAASLAPGAETRLRVRALRVL